MSGGLEHTECAESLGAYVLGALPAAESERVQRHIGTCRECRAEIEWLRVAADALPASVAQVEPPAELKSRVMAVVNAEAELLRAAGEAADKPPRPGRSWNWGWLTAAAWRPVAALGTAAAVAALAVVLVTGGGTRVQTFGAQMTVPGSATLTVRGTEARLTIRGLRSPAANHVDELWVKHGSAAPVPAGTFVLSSGSVQLQHPVRPGDVVLATEEPGRGTRAPTSKPFLFVHA